MNWMTSGRHRALRSKRGKKHSEMNFPAHVQQRETARLRRHPLAESRASATADENATAWYIRPILDANESHDIQMLEMAREAATGTCVGEDAAMAASVTARSKETDTIASTTTTTTSTEEKKKVQEKRCVFTPVKANRARPRAVTHRPVKKSASPQPRDLLLFNEGEQVSKVLPVATAPSWTAPPEVPHTASAISNARWSNDTRTNPGSDIHGRLGSRNEAPFYASTPSSSDEGSYGTPEPREKDPFSTESGRSNGVGIDRVHSAKLSRGLEFVSRKRPSMLEQLDNAMASTKFSFKQDGKSSTSNSQLSFSNDDHRLSTLSVQRGMNPQPLNVCAESDNHALEVSAVYDLMGQDGTRMQKSEAFGGCVDPLLVMPQPSFSSKNDERVHEGRNHGSVPDFCGVYDENRDSASSQGSFILPPPVDWQKKIVTRYNETPLSAEAMASPDHDHNSEPSPKVQTSLADKHMPGYCTTASKREESEQTTSSWRSSSRTEAILARVERRQMPRADSEGEHIAHIQRNLQEKDALVIYMHTLLQCHRIDEACKPS